jgi:hypothetical protein
LEFVEWLVIFLKIGIAEIAEFVYVFDFIDGFDNFDKRIIFANYVFEDLAWDY